MGASAELLLVDGHPTAVDLDGTGPIPSPREPGGGEVVFGPHDRHHGAAGELEVQPVVGAVVRPPRRSQDVPALVGRRVGHRGRAVRPTVGVHAGAKGAWLVEDVVHPLVLAALAVGLEAVIATQQGRLRSALRRRWLGSGDGRRDRHVERGEQRQGEQYQSSFAAQHLGIPFTLPTSCVPRRVDVTGCRARTRPASPPVCPGSTLPQPRDVAKTYSQSGHSVVCAGRRRAGSSTGMGGPHTTRTPVAPVG